MANSKKACKYCGDYRQVDELMRFGKFLFCDIDQAILWLSDKQAADKERAIKRAAKEVKQKNAKQKREFYDNDVNHQLGLTQIVFNKLRKLQELKWFSDNGIEPTCISCDKPNMDWCCGHLKTVGSQGAIRFDEVNTYLQCNRYCNKGLSGNINGNKTTRGYIQGLKDRFGEKKAQEIVDYCEVDRVAKWDAGEVKKMRIAMRKEIRVLERVLFT